MDLFKKRTVNFTAKEFGILMSLVLKFKSTIECKKTDKTNNDMKQKAWEQLSNEFNSICCEPFRDAKSLRCKYENQKKRTKQEFADEKVWLRDTGGGPGKPTICDEIDEKIKDIIGTQMTGFYSEFGGDCIQDNKQMESVCKTNFDSEVMEEDADTTDEEDCSFSANTNILETRSCSTALPTDWTKMTPDKLRTPKSKPLKTILKKACGKESKYVLSEKISLWATNKAKSASNQSEYLKKEHLLRIEMMKDRRRQLIALDKKESDERLSIQAKKAELELEILQIQKEQLLKK